MSTRSPLEVETYSAIHWDWNGAEMPVFDYKRPWIELPGEVTQYDAKARAEALTWRDADGVAAYEHVAIVYYKGGCVLWAYGGVK